MNAFFKTTNGFNFQIIDPLIESRGVRLTWFDCNTSIKIIGKKKNKRKKIIQKHAIRRGPGDKN